MICTQITCQANMRRAWTVSVKSVFSTIMLTL